MWKLFWNSVCQKEKFVNVMSEITSFMLICDGWLSNFLSRLNQGWKAKGFPCYNKGIFLSRAHWLHFIKDLVFSSFKWPHIRIHEHICGCGCGCGATDSTEDCGACGPRFDYQRWTGPWLWNLENLITLLSDHFHC